MGEPDREAVDGCGGGVDGGQVMVMDGWRTGWGWSTLWRWTGEWRCWGAVMRSQLVRLARAIALV